MLMKGHSMNSNTEIKEAVKDKYSQIARGGVPTEKTVSSCCGSNGCSNDATDVSMAPAYTDAESAAIPDGADLGLGCGTPTAFADLAEGMTVLDLGSGAGIDCFIASKAVGRNGKVIGVDMTDAMIQRANENKKKVHTANVEFRLGEIESLPVDGNCVDRVISNCVINLVPEKESAFKEIYRVLKPGGKFTVSDIVTDGVISDLERKNAALWAGCISGAIDRREYIGIIERCGFKNVRVISEKKYDYALSGGAGLYSITVTGAK